MATVNTIKTRILNKYDLLANYSTFTPLKGEVCVAVIGETTTTNGNFVGDLEKKPVVGLKVGDGVTSFNALPWVQAVAGDVSTFIKGIVDEAKFNELVNALITNANLATADQLSALDTRVGNLEAIVVNGDDSNTKLRAAINAVLGTSGDTAEANTVYGAKKYAEAQASANQTSIEAIENKIGEENIGTDTTITGAIKALQDTVGSSGTNSLGARVEALEGTVGDAEDGLVKDVADLQTATGTNASNISEINGKITTLVGEDTDKSVRAIAAEETAKIVAGADTNYDTLKEIADWIKSDTTGAAEMANDITELQGLIGVTEGEALPKTVDARITDAIAAAKTETETQVGALANGAVKTNADEIAAIKLAVEGMDATYADTNAGVVTAISQTDGKITSVTQRKIKAADVDETDIFVFYCGNATGYDSEMESVDL